MKKNPNVLSQLEGMEILLELIEVLVDSPEKKKEIKSNLQAAFKERKEVIAKYVLAEIQASPGTTPTKEQSDQIRLVSYNFV